eukprot:CAMPEP_0115240362 /NCGR_PEP_ID=MMETSP0270-20121206/37875_1 /TAXON_ID=71861 /ORGANISM="Scrippsiella trochoidea, Strain CCMP3099" /LENGTH=89 /DNA_ID=CAMNT_0002655349 /DNA_START=40 /DNA_END=307 /DNA_ORIENTATION=+
MHLALLRRNPNSKSTKATPACKRAWLAALTLRADAVPMLLKQRCAAAATRTSSGVLNREAVELRRCATMHGVLPARPAAEAWPVEPEHL